MIYSVFYVLLSAAAQIGTNKLETVYMVNAKATFF